VTLDVIDCVVEETCVIVGVLVPEAVGTWLALCDPDAVKEGLGLCACDCDDPRVCT
jgi:hypothetical protein